MKNLPALVLFLTLLVVNPVSAQFPGTPPPETPPATLPAVGSIYLQSNPTLCVDFKDYVGFAVPYSGQAAQKFKIEPGLATDKGVSFESVAYPGYFIRHQNSQIKLHPYADHDDLFAADATFLIKPRPDNGAGFLLRASNFWYLYLSVTRDNALFMTPNPRYEDGAFFIK